MIFLGVEEINVEHKMQKCLDKEIRGDIMVNFVAHRPLKIFEENFVAGPGIAPGLEDYEPSVQLYTTPHASLKEPLNYITKVKLICLFTLLLLQNSESRKGARKSSLKMRS